MFFQSFNLSCVLTEDTCFPIWNFIVVKIYIMFNNNNHNECMNMFRFSIVQHQMYEHHRYVEEDVPPQHCTAEGGVYNQGFWRQL